MLALDVGPACLRDDPRLLHMFRWLAPAQVRALKGGRPPCSACNALLKHLMGRASFLERTLCFAGPVLCNGVPERPYSTCAMHADACT